MSDQPPNAVAPRGSDQSTDRHLGPEETAHYAAGLLDTAERARIDTHIDGCGECRELLSTLVRTAISVTATHFGSPIATDSDADGVLPRGTKVGHFTLETPLGAGGMGVVYLAEDTRLHRKVALKSVRDRRTDSQQLLNEAKLMAQLAHPNVVPVYDVVEAYGQLFIAMELVTGRTIRQWLEGAKHTWQQVVDAFLEAGEGLAAAHRAGIVHGDVKPGNVLVGNDGRVRVTDFGLATSGVDESAPLRGTFAYIAPEQRKGKPCDAKCDQYAFAVSLHEGVFGALPGAPQTQRKGSAPGGVRRIIERALSAKPEERFASMDELLRALRAVRLARGRIIAGALAAAAVFALFTFFYGGQRATRAQCEAAASELTSPWTAEARTATREAFKRTKLSFADETLSRVETNLDAWSQSLAAAQKTACSASVFSREATPHLARELSCLQDGVLEARALVTQLLDADVALVLHAVAASSALAPPSRCLEAAATEVPVTQSAAASAVKERIAASRALALAGKYRDALPPAQEAVKLADASGDPNLRALAWTVLGGTQGLVFDTDNAANTLSEAIRLAEAAHEDRARCLAWSDLLTAEYARGHHDAVLQFAGPARGACERINDVRLLTDVLSTIGASLSEKGKNVEAKAMLEDAVKRRVDTFGESDRRTAAMLSVLANTMAMSGDLDAAIAAHEKALAAARAAFGAAHPETAVIEQNLGDDYLYGLQGDKAVASLTSAAETMAAANGPKARDAANATTDLGLAYLVVGKPQLALDTFEKAIAVWSENFPKHPAHAAALLGREQAKVALGQKLDVAQLEKAAELSGDLPPFERGRVLLELGLATQDKKKVLEAKAGLETTSLPLIKRELDRANAWLAAH
ncbi:MAG: protein kinase [Archangium sp.]